ncbi:HET domain-containing protein [Microdochium nivale]|nr:HET domain-containing protein [Microdochium nivale]
MLTAKTEAMLKNGCQISRLPRTIRDACAVAVRLGFRYLWVDRLCIMQDSAEDWDREAGRMALVYKNAALTISASAASGEDAGFFRRRRRGVQPLWLSVDTRRSANPSGFNEMWVEKGGNPSVEFKERTKDLGYTEFRRSLPDHPQYSMLSYDKARTRGMLGHLGMRGWTFQERRLSRRVLHFAEEQVYWECRSRVRRETDPMAPTFTATAGDTPLICSQALTRHSVPKLWHDLVSSYSQLSLTIATDRLPAVSGLANEFATAHGRVSGDTQYYAGLWKATFFKDLCWEAELWSPSEIDNRSHDNSIYIAPSWSWASYPGNVTMELTGTGGSEPISDELDLAEIRDVHLDYVGGNTFGALSSGKMTLYGRLIPITIQPLHGQDVDEPWGRKIKIIRPGDRPHPFIHYGVVDSMHVLGQLAVWERRAPSQATEPPAIDTLFCLPLYSRLQDRFLRARYLVLCPQGLAAPEAEQGDGDVASSFNLPRQYRRIGIATMMLEPGRSTAWHRWLGSFPKSDFIVR